MNQEQNAVEPPLREARDELKRAYLLVGFGQFDRAIEACQRAGKLAPDHALPLALEGSFQMAAGRMQSALATLRRATRRHPEATLPWVYFAEACFLSGRRRQGRRALETARQQADGEAHQALIARLDELWEAVEPDEVPPPLEVAPTTGV